MTTPSIQSYISPGTHVHLVGIGGISMSPLAEVLHQMGLCVTGSDLQHSPSLDHLLQLGIPVTLGHSAPPPGTDCLIRTAAVHEDNPEIVAARSANIPVFERAMAWGAIMTQYPRAICIAGTHGKTTTSSLCTQIFLTAQQDPTFMIGGILPSLGRGHQLGQGDTIILESCEYYNSFLSFHPTIAVLLNIDLDHLDFFANLGEIQQSFRQFAQRVPPNGWVVANGDDPNTTQALQGLQGQLLTFGLTQGQVHTQDLSWHRGCAHFQLIFQEAALGWIRLPLPGLHNVYNALAAAAAALLSQIPFQAIAQGISSFPGVKRRFEYKGCYQGAEIYDDYAHHPRELQALLSSVRSLGYQRVICAFQPHTYTRTKELFHPFTQALALADLVLLPEIYGAREGDTLGISSLDLAHHIPQSEYYPTLEQVTHRLQELASPGDLIITVGAGTIGQVGEALLRSAPPPSI